MFEFFILAAGIYLFLYFVTKAVRETRWWGGEKYQRDEAEHGRD